MTVQTPVQRSRPHPIDVHVGGRLRLRRLAVGLSQERLAKSIGITFQQIQKYERGTNRIVASRLHDLARVLDVPVNYFFTDIGSSRQPSMVIVFQPRLRRASLPASLFSRSDASMATASRLSFSSSET